MIRYTDSEILVYDDGMIIFGASDGYLYCVNLSGSSGEPTLRWKRDLGKPIQGSPILVQTKSGERLFVMSDDIIHSFYTYQHTFVGF